jgi:ABC-2 type transport system permease protein
MLRSLLAITSNTFTETIRQPIYGVVIGITLLLLIFSPSLAMFTMDDDNQLLRDIGLSTLLVAGLFLGVFAAASVVAEEIENKTVLTVLSKTVGRATFILGKFMGISAAIVLAEYLFSIVLLMVIRHGVLQTARDNPDTVVITLGMIAGTLTLLIGLAGNYFYRWRFTSTTIVLGTLLVTLVMGLLAFIDPDWQYNPAANHLRWDMIRPIILTSIAVLILSAIAITAATRLSLIMTLAVCATVFVLGVVLQHWLGPIAASKSGWASYLAWVPLAIVPCINFYVVTNAIYQGVAVPFSYIGQVAAYAFLYVSAILLFAIALFRSRELG